MYTYAVISPDGTSVIKRPASALTLKALQAAVGGYIEMVMLDGAEGIINEEGKLQGLARNEVATRLAQEYGAIADDDWIAGAMVVVGSDDEDGDITPLEKWWLLRYLPEAVGIARVDGYGGCATISGVDCNAAL